MPFWLSFARRQKGGIAQPGNVHKPVAATGEAKLITPRVLARKFPGVAIAPLVMYKYGIQGQAAGHVDRPSKQPATENESKINRKATTDEFANNTVQL